MRRRPVSVTVVGWLFIAAGVVGLAYHVGDFRTPRPFRDGVVWVALVRLLAVAGGVFLLRGHNWARWLLLAWLAYHVVLSALHTPFELVFHGVLLLAIAYLLFRPGASAYFAASGRGGERRLS
ncbi:MAG TPA: hypothetical protein VFB66_00655 [Tepidisphaeraceae bacterium]|nr:hypothetical protein [Tepidisphaeraceae bacterium]